jgi:hypothetical protein
MRIQDIISKCGGPEKIANASDGKISLWAPQKWHRIGIPETHWSLISKLCGATPEQLHELNEAVRVAAAE